jgi:hypothetical protein
MATGEERAARMELLGKELMCPVWCARGGGGVACALQARG